MSRKTKIGIVAGVLVLAATFGAGWRVGKGQREIVKHDSTTKVEETKVANQAKTADIGNKTVDEKPKVVIKRRTSTKRTPDGTVTTTREEEREETADRHTEETKAHIEETKHSEAHKSEVQVVHDQVIKPVPVPLPRWLLGAGVGLSVPGALGGDPGRQLLPFAPRVSRGIVTVDARIFSKIWAGAWGDTTGTVGLGLRVGW